MSNASVALVIGATGGIGGEVARALAARGWTVRGLARDIEAAQKRWKGPPLDWRQGDAMNASEVTDAARGAAIIFHGANPPGYRNWAGLALPMLESTIAAARAAGARIVFPGTLYNYGPDAFPLITEAAPQRPLTRKGHIRAEMERRLEAASAVVPVLIVRAGDFFGPSVGNSWFGQGIVKPGRPITVVTYPGDPEAGHAFAYLPDLAETFAELIARVDELPGFARFHFEGHDFARGVEIAERVRIVAGRPDLPIRRFPWWAITLASPFIETFRELLEMRYLWRETVRLDNRKLIAFLGREPHTPTDDALRATLVGLGCLG